MLFKAPSVWPPWILRKEGTEEEVNWGWEIRKLAWQVAMLSPVKITGSGEEGGQKHDS